MVDDGQLWCSMSAEVYFFYEFNKEKHLVYIGIDYFYDGKNVPHFLNTFYVTQ
jgi:hypothetical protein